MLVAFAATIFMWKLILLGGMSLDYFVAYLAYGTGHQTLNKFLETRDKARPVAVPPAKEEEDPPPKPPKP